MDKKTTGDWGEALALEYLEKRGYCLVEKNYRHKRAEIDLIMCHEKTLVFIEVKARSGTEYGFPEEAVDEKKATMIIEAADHYIYESAWEGNIRFDVIAVMLQPQVSVQHFEDAFW